MNEINRVQNLMFELMKLASFNSYDGQQVVSDLIDHKDLWRGAILDRDDLIKLRDIENDKWNVDTLFILTTGVNDVKLEELAHEWCADEIKYLSDEEAKHALGQSYPLGRVLSIWWD